MQPAVGTRGVYVLELETGGFYVGKSENVQARVQMRKHGFDNVRGFEWTRCGPLEASDYQTIRGK